MKKLLSLLLFASAFNTLFCQPDKKDTILIFHPTVANINTIMFLAEEQILPADEFHFKGVFHTNGSYDYSLSRSYLSENSNLPFSLLEIRGELSENDLFNNNSCTELFNRIFKNSKGAVFLGGPDIPPGIYNEPHHLLTLVKDPWRHYLELSYLFHIMGGGQDPDYTPLMSNNPHYGVLGICLGMQSINVATGGTMVQDIPQEVYGQTFIEELLNSDQQQVHSNYYQEPDNDSLHTSYHFHTINLKSETSFFKELVKISGQAQPSVLSSHHQALDRKGTGLETAATSLDGKIIEAVTHRYYDHVVGVQFHPEKTGLYDPELTFSIHKDSIISFNKYIVENASYSFHLNFWKQASDLFRY